MHVCHQLISGKWGLKRRTIFIQNFAEKWDVPIFIQKPHILSKFKNFTLDSKIVKLSCKQISELKGALDNFSLIPFFFFKKVEIFISLEVYTYVVTAC